MIILAFIIIYLFQRIDFDAKAKDIINKILFVAAIVYFLLVALTDKVVLIQ